MKTRDDGAGRVLRRAPVAHVREAKAVPREARPRRMSAREIGHRVIAIDAQHALFARNRRHPIHDAGVAFVIRQAGDVLRIDEHDVDLVRSEPGERLAQIVGEILGIDPRDGVVGADLPDEKVGPQRGQLGLQALGRVIGHRARLRARDHLDVEAVLLEVASELARIGGDRRGRIGGQHGGRAERDDAGRPLFEKRAPDGPKRCAAVERRAFDTALGGQRGRVARNLEARRRGLVQDCGAHIAMFRLRCIRDEEKRQRERTCAR